MEGKGEFDDLIKRYKSYISNKVVCSDFSNGYNGILIKVLELIYEHQEYKYTGEKDDIIEFLNRKIVVLYYYSLNLNRTILGAPHHMSCDYPEHIIKEYKNELMKTERDIMKYLDETLFKPFTLESDKKYCECDRCKECGELIKKDEK